MTDTYFFLNDRKWGGKLVEHCNADLVFLNFVLALLGGAEYCNKESKKDDEDFQGSGKKSVAL